MIRVLLVHDVSLVRSVLAEWLRRTSDLTVYDAPWRCAPGSARSLQPDVCAADLERADSYEMPPLGELRGRSGTEPRLVVLATVQRPGLLRRAFDVGALGYVDKESPPERLVSVIRRVAGGERFVDDSLGFGFLRAAGCR